MKFALLGTPISHSLSPVIHSIFANECGLEVSYELIDTDANTLKETIQRLKDDGYMGFNCTMPLKTEIIAYLDEKSAESSVLKSCNTVKIENGQLKGYTTDGFGIEKSIEKYGNPIEGSDVLMFGTGGTARSALYSLIKSGARSITVLNRSETGLKSLELLSKSIENKNTKLIFDLLTIENANHYAENIGIYINSTSLGMTGFDEFENFDFLKNLSPGTVVFDAVYNPIKTNLLTNAEICGHKTVNGLYMLVYQGIKAFSIWTGKDPMNAAEKAYVSASEKI